MICIHLSIDLVTLVLLSLDALLSADFLIDFSYRSVLSVNCLKCDILTFLFKMIANGYSYPVLTGEHAFRA